METIGPATRRNATGPLRRLFWRMEDARPAPRRRFWTYLAPLGLLALIGLGFTANEYYQDNRVLPGIVMGLLAAGSVLPVAVCVRWPVLAWRIAFLMMFLGVINQGRVEPWPWNPVQIVGFLLVLARLAVTQSSAVTVWATTFSLVPVFLYTKSANTGGAAVLLVAIAALGNIVYRRRRTLELVAEQEVLTEQERGKRAVLEERARIAREMHDVVAHHMSMIAVRAETAPYRVTGLPDAAQEELAEIAKAARSALTDMRRLLGALRAEDGESPTVPQPGLADLDDLVSTAREAGVDVTLTADGLAAVPGTVGLAAYRIMQEALANAARHAPGGPVSIDARGLDDRLELVVRNRRTGPATPGGGHGLIGMRERAALLGGELTAEPDQLDFVVRATLPFGKVDE
ncbi:sensor histidine kinase [Paractinoplanes globisporus]|uniref:histidine kinase n=1 Tax=Paractinoplanes globisporus TaxID=113565 RepID=A0ABW6WG10_9ACTN|nr:histidine kinase [Actinoplanes globisporus]